MMVDQITKIASKNLESWVDLPVPMIQQVTIIPKAKWESENLALHFIIGTMFLTHVSKAFSREKPTIISIKKTSDLTVRLSKVNFILVRPAKT